MNKKILSLVFFAILLFTATTVSAKGVIIYSNGEKIETVMTLPDSAVIDNSHVNLGVMYKQFAIFWIPMWNYGETKFVLVNDKKDTYYDLDAEDIETLKTEFNVTVPAQPAIGFWNKIGGKIIWIALILAAVYGWWISRKDDKNAETPKPEE